MEHGLHQISERERPVWHFRVRGKRMLSVLRVLLPSEIPVVGCELNPYVLVRLPDGCITPHDIPESAPSHGFYLQHKWYQSDKSTPVCSVHQSELATLQCLCCVRAKASNTSYHCSAKCFADSWKQHHLLHACAEKSVEEKRSEEEDNFGCLIGADCVGTTESLALLGLSHSAIPVCVAEQRRKWETWFEVGKNRIYTPSAKDVGHMLKLKCIAVDATTGQALSPANTVITARVIPAPSPTPRRMIPLDFTDVHRPARTVTILSYNVLADIYASNEVHSYCPSWALSWSYRRQNLLREIVGYKADILCLQEVQSNHFTEFFAPELEKHGYTAIYKKKTSEVYTGTAYAYDGCATFFRQDLFSVAKKYEVEFSRAALSLTETSISAAQKKTASSRLLKDNVALIVVLEARGSGESFMPERRQLLCVANTHIHANRELKDVKLWQVQTLVKRLEKIAVSGDIPMIVCGDFNSVPGSAPHALLASGRVDATHPDLDYDPFGILRPISKLHHQLPLVSAYSAFVQLEQAWRHMDVTMKEPLFTNCTRKFLGTLDYIFYTADSLAVMSLLELLDEESVRRDTALPSSKWSSDHIALVAQICWKERRQ